MGENSITILKAKRVHVMISWLNTVPIKIKIPQPQQIYNINKIYNNVYLVHNASPQITSTFVLLFTNRFLCSQRYVMTRECSPLSRRRFSESSRKRQLAPLFDCRETTNVECLAASMFHNFLVPSKSPAIPFLCRNLMQS